jgi:glycosyltransferase involved in cell wall biosynthesis
MTATPSATPKSVDIMIPVLNEAHVLERSVNTVRAFCAEHLPYRWRIVVVDNGSTDGTQEVAQRLALAFPEDVGFHRLDVRGRGRALRRAWTQSQADICCYTDVDLSTELAALPKIVDAIAHGGCDVATGSRLQKGRSQVTRSLKRYIISKCYNIMVRRVLGVHFSDAQCGFKAVSRRAIERIVPQIRDESWFFDTELLVLAEKQGYRIADIPVRWIEDDDSRVKILKTAWDDIKGILRLRLLLWQWALGGGDPPRRRADAPDAAPAR